MNIELTESGKLLALEAAEQRNRRHMEMFSCLSDNEKDTLLALLEKVNTDWESRYQENEEKHRHFGHHHGDHKHHNKERR